MTDKKLAFTISSFVFGLFCVIFDYYFIMPENEFASSILLFPFALIGFAVFGIAVTITLLQK